LNEECKKGLPHAIPWTAIKNPKGEAYWLIAAHAAHTPSKPVLA
jgi:hypothetical protein